MLLDLHIHSKYSYDSLSEPKKIVKVARQRGLDAIAITDHDTMEGFRVASSINQPDIMIIPGLEKKTDHGDVIGLFINKEVSSNNFFDAADEIHSQGGIVVLPHPYRSRNCDPVELMAAVDLLEVFNSRYRDEDNFKAKKLAESNGKPCVVGSDAHLYFEIGHAVTTLHGQAASLNELREMLLKSPREFRCRSTPYYLSHGLSFGIYKIRKYLGHKL